MAIAGPVTITAFLIGTLLSACSGGPGATDTDVGPTPSRATTTTSASPSTTPGVLDDAALARIPRAARAHTPAGAEAFARFYLEQFNQAWLAPDPDLIRPYALDSCKTCANFVATATWLRDEGLHYDRPPTKVGPSGWLPETTTDVAFVQVVNNQLDRRILRRDGGVEQHLHASPALNEVELRWTDDTWLIAAIRIAK